jgi:dihydrodipicolinate synthase/N-acetylneuraminate lyase
LVTTAVAVGGTGSITAAASVAPALVTAVQQGRTEQVVLDEVRTLLEAYGLGPSVKAILRRAALGEYATRPPLRGLEADRADALWEDYCALVSPANRPTIR